MNDNYVATIKTATGTYQDTGYGQTHVGGFFCDPNCLDRTTSTENVVSTSLLPIDTTGKATGGGQILNATTQQDVTFGFEVHSTQDPDQLQGRCSVIDQAGNTHVKCLNRHQLPTDRNHGKLGRDRRGQRHHRELPERPGAVAGRAFERRIFKFLHEQEHGRRVAQRQTAGTRHCMPPNYSPWRGKSWHPVPGAHQDRHHP